MVSPGGMRGGRPRARRAPAGPAKKRVLFVCIGNACRSQMAEGFAKAYGADVMIAASAGLSPATMIPPLTKKVLGDRNIRIDDHFPKPLETVSRQPYDLAINMSGMKVPLPAARTIEWPVPDPIGQKEETYQTVASQIEALVMRLILELRSPPR